MTIESQVKLWGAVPLGKKHDVGSATSFEYKFGRLTWSIADRYHVLNEDQIIHSTIERGLVVEPDRSGEREPERFYGQTLSQDEINDAQIALPVHPLTPGIVRVLTWKPTK